MTAGGACGRHGSQLEVPVYLRIRSVPRTLDDHLEVELLPTRAAAQAAAGLGTLAFILSAVGLYGLVSWFVERRHREIGVRLAIGARPADIVRMVVRQTVSAAAPGLVSGV